jgi:hypothetical protein
MASTVTTNSYPASPHRRILDAATGLRSLNRPQRREAGVALAACLVAFAAYTFIALHGTIGRTIQIEHIDLNVYRAGARAVLDGTNLYGTLPAAAPGIDLPFTYPPIAALLLAPLAILPSALDAFTGLGALAAPRDSSEYWLHAVFQTDRIGAIWYAANQSLEAVLSRFGLTGHALSASWNLACILVLTLAWITMRRAAAFGTPVGVLLLNALGSSARHGAPRQIRSLAVVAFAVFALGPQWLLPHGDNRELHWALWEQILGGAYVWFGLAVLVTVALTSPAGRRRHVRAHPVRTGPSESRRAW